ncbi:MAG: GNAT family N-acetyltransferase [Clostridia bacterium]|nr:GNAT family N-acetyltransferase [Clostridia bacterium]
MKNIGTQDIYTARLILRRFSMDDAQKMFDNWASDDEVTTYLTWPTHRTVEDTKDILKLWTNSYEKDNFYLWAICFVETPEEPIGSISVVAMNEDISEIEIGYCIQKDYWHQGVTSEAFQGLIEYFFNETDVNRIIARYDVRNINSGYVMKKCGLMYEGTLRSGGRNNQGICDCDVYSILRKDYFHS